MIFLLYVFIGCLAFGVFYSAVAFLLGGHGDSGHDCGIDHDIGVGNGVDIGHDISAGHGVDLGHDIDVGDVADIGHDISIGHGADGAVGADAGHDGGTHHGTHGDDASSPSPFNPLVIASAITTFGAVGLISMIGFGMDGLISTIVALGFAGGIGVALFFGVVKFMYGSQSNSIFSLDDLVGFEAEVITPIPEKGFGEIAYMANGIRSTLSAKSTEGSPIQRSATVVIREITGSVAMVQQKMSIDDIVFENASLNSQSGGGVGESGSAGDGSTGEIGSAGDTGELEDEDGGKPRRNAGNKNL